MARNPDIIGVLARHGLTPGPNGFGVDALQALAAAHGWRAEVEEQPSIRSGYRPIPPFHCGCLRAARPHQ